jgi:hypothetical protein
MSSKVGVNAFPMEAQRELTRLDTGQERFGSLEMGERFDHNGETYEKVFPTYGQKTTDEELVYFSPSDIVEPK